MADKQKVRSINIDVADNGYSVRCDYEPKETKGNEPMPYPLSNKPKVFNGLDAMLAHVKDELAGTQEKKPKVRVLGVALVRHGKESGKHY